MVEINLIIGLIVITVFLLFLKSLPSKLSDETIPKVAVKHEVSIEQTLDHDYIPCDVCNKPAIGRFTGHTGSLYGNRYSGSMMLPTQYYCSKECRKSNEYPKIYIILILALTIISFTLASSGDGSDFVSALGFIGVAISLFFMFFLLRPKRGFRTPQPYEITESTHYSTVKKEDRIKAFKSEEDNSVVYSELVGKNVRQCCYQSARLNDKYCICGRAVEYPVS